MILDRQSMVSYKQALTVSAASADIINLGPPTWNKSAGGAWDIPMAMAIDEVFASAGATTLQVEIQSSPLANFASGVVSHHTRTFQKSELSQSGKMPLSWSLPQDVQQFVRANYTIANGPFTAGKITLGVIGSRQSNR